MTVVPKSSPWDFGDALELLKTPQGLDESPKRKKNAAISTPALEKTTGTLGDFSKIWKDIGSETMLRDGAENVSTLGLSPLFTATTAARDFTVPDPNQPVPPGPTVREETYASDGGYNPSRKNVSWKEPDTEDIFEATDEPTTPTSEEGPGESSAGESLNTRQKRKATAKAERKAAKVAEKLARKQQGAENKARKKATRLRKTVSDVESESEIRKMKKPSPASKASKHAQQKMARALVIPSPHRGKTKQNSETPKKVSASDTEKQNKQTPKKMSMALPSSPFSGMVNYDARAVGIGNIPPSPYLTLAKSTTHVVSTPLQNDLFGGHLFPSSVPQPAKRPSTQAPPQMLQPQASENLPPIPSTAWSSNSLPQQVPHSFTPGDEITVLNHEHPMFKGNLNQDIVLINPNVGVLQVENAMLTQISLSSHQTHSLHPSTPIQPPITIIESLQQSLNPEARPQFQILEKEERDLQLFLRLIHVFGEDKKWLTKPVPLADHNASPTGIHVFVDFSNIWIGFMDYLKRLQQIPKQARIPHQNLSFDSLVLLLERKRPVAKRVLAGSYPLLPAMELAKAIGYETNILDKVYKARELTEKQRRFQSIGLHQNNRGLGTQASGSSPSTPMVAPEKWVEQGVDEILHLKILESIVDADKPSRMVVATGDGSQAEYSEGFMKMIVRALKKGWEVELVAFSMSIMKGYLSREFILQWEGRFRIICLDEWAEFLLDT